MTVTNEMEETSEDIVDVIVLGAGISGLVSALRLSDNGLNVKVLEARDRVGGRIYTLKGDSFDYVDVGAAYLGRSQHRIIELAEELEVETYLMSEEGDEIIYTVGKRMITNVDDIPRWSNPIAWMDCNNLFWNIDRMAQQVPLDAPWEFSMANEWDSMTCESWFKSMCWTKQTKAYADILVRVEFAVEPSDLSLLFFLWYFKAAGGVKKIHLLEDGAQEMKFVGGTQQLCEKLMERIGRENVKLSDQVIKVKNRNDDVIVSTASGKNYKAKYVVSTVPPNLLSRITFHPSLPSSRIQLIQRMPMGSCIKTFTYYKESFWSKKGYSGTVLSDGPLLALDDTKPDGSHPALMSFLNGDWGRKLARESQETRKRVLCEMYAEMFETDEALHPVEYIDYNWMAEEYSGGCYVCALPPGVLTRFGQELRRPIGRIHFAGTETATVWAGYMDGAVQSAERAVQEVLERMDKIILKNTKRQRQINCQEVPQYCSLHRSLVEQYLLPSVPGLITGITCLSIVTMVMIYTKPTVISTSLNRISHLFNK
ncbi:amine oxidase [flavin-containing] A-like [Glandiceps talaboti]